MSNRLNYKRMVREKCIDCIHDEQSDGSALQQVSACPGFDCPLWDCRPVSRAKWPNALVDSIVSTLGMNRQDVLAWAENPRAKPNLPDDFRQGGLIARSTHPVYGPEVWALYRDATAERGS